MLAKDIYITFNNGKGYHVSDFPIVGQYYTDINIKALATMGKLGFASRTNIHIMDGEKRNRRDYCLVTVHFGSKGWYVFDRKSDCFLLEDGKLTSDDVFYVPTRAAARELIKRYFICIRHF